MYRRLAFLAALLVLTVNASAAADTVVITSGAASLYWDGSQTSFTLTADDSNFVGEYFGSALAGFDGGDTVDFSATISVSNAGNRGLAQTYRGTAYPDAWVSGTLTFTARRFVAPHATPASDGQFTDFTTTFTMTGTITAYASPDRTGTPLFTTGVAGSGTVGAGPYRIIGDSYLLNSGGQNFTFTESATPPLPAPWQSADVGNVGQSGTASYANGTFTVSGAGADIWGTADSFHFVSQALSGDGHIVATVTAVQGTNPYAKAGVMVRDGDGAGAAAVILDVKPDGCLEFMARPAPGRSMAWIAGNVAGRACGHPTWLKLVRSQSVFSALVSSDGRKWQRVGSTSVVMGPIVSAGLAVTSHNRSVLNTSSFTNVAVSRLGEGWSHTDVGAVGTPGCAAESNGVFSVSGAGADIWGTADSFAAVTQLLNAEGGDGTVTARVVSEQNTHMFAKAGVTIGALTPGSARVILDVKNDGNLEFMARLANGSSMSFLAGAGASFPVWLRLRRNGERIDGEMSADGQAWTAVGSVTMTLPTSVPAGLAVTSHNPSVLNTATFDNVSVLAGTTALTSP